MSASCGTLKAPEIPKECSLKCFIMSTTVLQPLITRPSQHGKAQQPVFVEGRNGNHRNKAKFQEGRGGLGEQMQAILPSKKPKETYLKSSQDLSSGGRSSPSRLDLASVVKAH